MIDQLVLLGISHQTAPLSVRERIVRLSENPDLSLDRVRGLPGVAEGMLLSTCNRVELYGAGRPEEAVLAGFRDLLAREPQVVPHLYERRGEAALRHLFRVAASLDSMVVGEPQILGQLKQAYLLATRSGAAGDTLQRAVGKAFAVAKRVRTETAIGRSAVSMVHAAVELSERVFALRGKCALVLGAGEMSGLVAQKLLSQGVGSLVILNRTAARAEALAAKLQSLRPNGSTIRALGLDQLALGLSEADLVVSAVAVETPLVTRERLQPLLRGRRFRPLLFVDLSVPRAIDPGVASLENVYRKDVDDIGRLVAQNTARRFEEAQRAEEIVEAEVETFTRVLRGRSAVPVLAELRRFAREIADSELAHTLSRLGPSLDAAQRDSVAAMAEAIVNKLLHAPTARLRQAAEAGLPTPLAEAAGELFGLSQTLEVGGPTAEPAPANAAAFAPKSDGTASPREDQS